MAEGYWGDAVDPDEDDFDRWCNPDDDDDDDGEDASLDEHFEALGEVLNEVGPAAVLEAVSAYLYELPRPFARCAYRAHKVAEQVYRAEGAVEEAYQTRGIKSD